MSIDTSYVVHHTHTDIGFTNDQPILWEVQYRDIDRLITADKAGLIEVMAMQAKHTPLLNTTLAPEIR